MYKGVSLTLLAIATIVLSMTAGPGCNSTQVSSGILYQNQNNHQKAVRMFRQALVYNDEEAAAHYQLAWSLSILAKDDDFNGAIDSCRAKLSEAFEHYLLAKKYAPEDYDVTPERDHSPAEDAIASNYSHYFNKAVKYNEAGRAEDAATYFELAYAADPRGDRGFQAKVNYLKLRLNLAAEQEDEATIAKLLDDLNSVKAPTPEDEADLVNTKATALRNLGRNAEAAQLYESLLANNPDDVSLLEKVADARIESGDHVGAGELLDHIVQIVQNDTEMEQRVRYQYMMKACYNWYDAEQYEKCIADGQKAIALASTDDERASIYRRTVRAYYELGNWKKAIEVAETLLQLDPDDYRVWQVYYLSLDKDGRRDDALKARDRYLELKGN